MNKLLFGFIIFSVTHSGLIAENLSFYRSQIPSPTTQMEVNQQRNKLFELLSTQPDFYAPLLGQLQDAGYLKIEGKDHFFSSALFFKTELGNVLRAFKNEDQFGKPPAFDPSMQIYEIDQEQELLRKTQFKTAVGNFDSFLLKLHAYILQIEKISSLKTSTSLQENDFVKIISNWMSLDSNLIWAQKLGELKSLEIESGQITRLNFTRDAHRLPLNLGMLVSLRTGEDDYYVLALSTLLSLINDKLIPFYESDATGSPTPKKLNSKEKIEFQRLQKVEAFVKEKFEGAVAINRWLHEFTDQELNILLGLFIALLNNDLPLTDELSKIAQYVSDNNPNFSSQSSLPQPVVDFMYYNQLFRDLQNLEIYLGEEKERLEFKSKLIQDIEESAE